MSFFCCTFATELETSITMISPFALPPHPAAQKAAAEVIAKMHDYMAAHPESELHRQGKMFGVLIYNDGMSASLNDAAMLPNDVKYLSAFSAQLDGSYYHEGFVPPAFSMNNEQLTMNISPVGHSKEESRRLQRLLFAQYNFVNARGESKNLLEIFADEKPIFPEDLWFSEKKFRVLNSIGVRSKGMESLEMRETLPPSGAGECCGPKLLQYAFTHGLQPLALAEFWVGAPSRTEIRREGVFYAPCSGKCVPILRWMLGNEGMREVVNEGMRELVNEGMSELVNEGIEVIYDDEWLTVVNKPAGLLSVPGKGEELSIEDFLSHQQSAFSSQPFLKAVHRLDQDTSGLLVLAKTPEVYKTLQAYFQRRDILKRYEAVVQPSEVSIQFSEEGEISLPLLPNPYDRPRQMVNLAHGKPAITRYKVRERRTDGTLFLDFFPLTGRTHQLRVHTAHPEGLNAPIVGDRLYGVPGERLMLHAAEIEFLHPITQKRMHFLCPSAF